MSKTPVILTIYVRHATDCKYNGDELSRRCKCPKHLRWSKDSTQRRKTAGTRSRAEAGQVKRQIEDQLADRPTENADDVKSIEESIRLFIQFKRVEGLTAGVIGKYSLELPRLGKYFNQIGVFTV